MAVQSTSYQFSASYRTSVTWKREAPSSSPVTPEDVENAKPLKLEPKLLSEQDFWQKFWCLKETETVNDDGSVTKTVSGGVNILSAGRSGYVTSGQTRFQVSAAFDAATYEAGQLTGTVDIMAAAHAAAKHALFEAADCLRAANYYELKNAAANSFADMVGAPLEEQGHAGERDKVYKSVHAVFASFEAKYEAVTASAGKDSWLDADLWTAAVKLQKTGMSFQMESGRAKGLYSLRELEFAAIGIRSAGMNLRA